MQVAILSVINLPLTGKKVLVAFWSSPQREKERRIAKRTVRLGAVVVVVDVAVAKVVKGNYNQISNILHYSVLLPSVQCMFIFLSFCCIFSGIYQLCLLNIENYKEQLPEIGFMQLSFLFSNFLLSLYLVYGRIVIIFCWGIEQFDHQLYHDEL